MGGSGIEVGPMPLERGHHRCEKLSKRSQLSDLLKMKLMMVHLCADGKLCVPSQAKQLIQRLLLWYPVTPWRASHDNSSSQTFCHRQCSQVGKTNFKIVLALQARIRPWSDPAEVADRNEVLHMEFLSMGETIRVGQEIWFAAWMSDQVSHFKNQILEGLSRRVGTLQKFVPVYTPWVNDTVERLNQDILQVFRALLMEWNLDTKHWEYVLPVVPHYLNNSPVASFANRFPVQLFTGLPTTTPLDVLLQPGQTAAATRLRTTDMEQVGPSLDKL
ncbi:hypothetical protein PHMEG_00035426, partial [Phytophthora megakarya]